MSFPFMFKGLFIANVLEFKVHIYYLSNKEPAPMWVRVLLVILYLIGISISLSAPLMAKQRVELSPQEVWSSRIYLILLSLSSIFMLLKLKRGVLKQPIFEKSRFKLYLLEILMQIIIFGRLTWIVVFKRIFRKHQ
jgi:hypothetical protein